MAEYTALAAWVKQWLTYVRWYHTKAQSLDLFLQDLFEAPFVNREWNVETTNPL